MLFFSGFDAASQTGPVWHNTAWIYRAELPDERVTIRWEGGGPVVGVDTAHGWQYGLESSTNLITFAPLGAPVAGSNSVHETEINDLPPASRYFRWRIERP